MFESIAKFRAALDVIRRYAPAAEDALRKGAAVSRQIADGLEGAAAWLDGQQQGGLLSACSPDDTAELEAIAAECGECCRDAEACKVTAADPRAAVALHPGLLALLLQQAVQALLNRIKQRPAA